MLTRREQQHSRYLPQPQTPSSPQNIPGWVGSSSQLCLCPGLLETLILVWIIPRGMQGHLFQLEMRGKVIQPIPKVFSLLNTCLSMSKGAEFICRVGAREGIPHSPNAAPQVKEWHGDREWQWPVPSWDKRAVLTGSWEQHTQGLWWG